MKYTIAIPSYKRPDTLKNKTMNLLSKHNIEPNKIIIFVANQQQENEYQNTLEPNTYNKLVKGKKGIKNIRNFMSKYFDEGEPVFYMDDDISEMYQNYNNINKHKNRNIINNINSNYDRSNNYLLPLQNLNNFIENGFLEAKKKKCDNWGVYPIENPYFMKPTSNNKNDFLSTKLNYIMGGLTGVFNNKKAEVRTLDDKEDYERTIKYYLKDNGVLRFNNVCARTNCYNEPGGMQIDRTYNRILESAKYLCKKYPYLCTLNLTKKSGYPEVRMKDNRNNNNNIKVKVIKSHKLKKNNNNLSKKNIAKRKDILNYFFKNNNKNENNNYNNKIINPVKINNKKPRHKSKKNMRLKYYLGKNINNNNNHNNINLNTSDLEEINLKKKII